MEVHSSKQGLLGIDDDLGLDGPPKRPKQSASLCRICYGVFTVVTVTVALIFTLIVVGDLLGIYAVRSNNNHENGGTFILIFEQLSFVALLLGSWHTAVKLG